MTTANKSSRILSEMQETASGLHTAGIISKRRLGEIEALCRLDIEAVSPEKFKALREKMHVSQAVFAALLNTSLSTVQKWEAGAKKPSGPSLKLLNLIERKGLEAVL